MGQSCRDDFNCSVGGNVEGRGLREWDGAVYLFRSEDYESAFQRALAIGEGGHSGGEEGIQRPRWVETRRAEVVTLDRLGSELEDVLDAKGGQREDPFRTFRTQV